MKRIATFLAAATLLSATSCVSPLVISGNGVHVGLFHVDDNRDEPGRRDTELTGFGISVRTNGFTVGWIHSIGITITDPNLPHQVELPGLTAHTGALATSLELLDNRGRSDQ